MAGKNWDEIAREYIESEKINLAKQSPRGDAVLVEWKGQVYAGSVQKIEPEYDKEIVLLSKTSVPIPNELQKAILKAQPKRIKLNADNSLDLEGMLHIVRMSWEKLGIMNPEQLRHMQGNLIIITDSDTGETASIGRTVLYKDGKRLNPEEN